MREVGSGVPGVNGAGRLEVKISESIQRLAFAPDQAASRSDDVVVATFTLYDSNDKAIIAAFHARHAEIYSHADEKAAVQLVALRVVIAGRTPKPTFPERDATPIEASPGRTAPASTSRSRGRRPHVPSSPP